MLRRQEQRRETAIMLGDDPKASACRQGVGAENAVALKETQLVLSGVPSMDIAPVFTYVPFQQFHG
jgi:hypothetical protein